MTNIRHAEAQPKHPHDQLPIRFGAQLRNSGMNQAETHANHLHHGWSHEAYSFLEGYARINPTFMAEDVRTASAGVVPPPPSKRAWGAVIVRAAKAGIITSLGTRKVKNPRAHCANATLWKSKLFNRTKTLLSTEALAKVEMP